MGEGEARAANGVLALAAIPEPLDKSLARIQGCLASLFLRGRAKRTHAGCPTFEKGLSNGLEIKGLNVVFMLKRG
jgi:sulfur transfer protein SufE